MLCKSPFRGRGRDIFFEQHAVLVCLLATLQTFDTCIFNIFYDCRFPDNLKYCSCFLSFKSLLEVKRKRDFQNLQLCPKVQKEIELSKMARNLKYTNYL